MNTLQVLKNLRSNIRKRQTHYIHNELPLPSSKIPDHRKAELILDWVVEEIDRISYEVAKAEKDER